MAIVGATAVTCRLAFCTFSYLDRSTRPAARVLADATYKESRDNEDTDNDRDNNVTAHSIRTDGATTDGPGLDERNAGDSAGKRSEDPPSAGAINEGDSRA